MTNQSKQQHQQQQSTAISASSSSSVSSKLERTKLSCTGTLQKVKRVYLWTERVEFIMCRELIMISSPMKKSSLENTCCVSDKSILQWIFLFSASKHRCKECSKQRLFINAAEHWATRIIVHSLGSLLRLLL